MLFLFTAAEEEGSLGSHYYVTKPSVSLERTLAAINLDAGAPLAPPRSWYLEGGGGTRLDSAARRVAARHGWSVTAEPARFSSDQWRFHERGVPSTLLVPGEGWEGVTPEQENQLIQRWWRAHRPDDELHRAVRQRVGGDHDRGRADAHVHVGRNLRQERIRDPHHRLAGE